MQQRGAEPGSGGTGQERAGGERGSVGRRCGAAGRGEPGAGAGRDASGERTGLGGVGRPAGRQVGARAREQGATPAASRR